VIVGGGIEPPIQAVSGLQGFMIHESSSIDLKS